jgi:putative intracellular protease/amidase
MRLHPTVPASLSLLLVVAAAAAQDQVIPLWPGGAPGSEGRTEAETVRVTEDGEHIISSVHRPSVAAYPPDEGSATGAAVVVIPGGSHRELWLDHEGYREAEWLRARGIAASS